MQDTKEFLQGLPPAGLPLSPDEEIQMLKNAVAFKQNHVAHQQRMKTQAQKKKQHKKRKK